MEKENRNKEILMKKIEYISDEIDKGSTGCFKDKFGHIYYLLNGKCHRSDGPAVEWSDGDKYWFFYGKRHRSDGPALEWSDGITEWYYYEYVADSEKEFYDPEWRKRVEIEIFL